MPPEVVSFSHDNGALIQIGAFGQAVFLAAVDPDEDEVGFRWSLSVDGLQATAEEVDHGSQLWLDPLERLDGQELRCEVSDGQHQATTFIWPLEVLP